MSIPDYQSLMLPVLVASSKGEVRIGPVVDELANQLGLQVRGDADNEPKCLP
jgi:restriction system protein